MAGKKRRPDSLYNNKKRDKFCQTLEQTGNVTAAAESIGVSRVTVYNWRKRWPNFESRWQAAKAKFIDDLEGRIIAVAQGRITVDRNELLALMFVVKRHFPEYRDSHKPETINANVEVADSTLERIGRAITSERQADSEQLSSTSD